MANHTLVPVSHDPFSNRPFSREFNVLTANMAVTVNKLTELVAKIDAVGAAAHKLDALLQVEIRKVAEIVAAGGDHFDEKLAQLRADIADVAASTKQLGDLGRGVGTSASWRLRCGRRSKSSALSWPAMLLRRLRLPLRSRETRSAGRWRFARGASSSPSSARRMEMAPGLCRRAPPIHRRHRRHRAPPSASRTDSLRD
jgi:hypothetical protein